MLLVIVFGFDAQDDVIGAGVGHLYYFLVDVLPKIPETSDMKVLRAPSFLTRICEWLRLHEFGGQFDELGQAGWFFAEDEQEDPNVAQLIN